MLLNDTHVVWRLQYQWSFTHYFVTWSLPQNLQITFWTHLFRITHTLMNNPNKQTDLMMSHSSVVSVTILILCSLLFCLFVLILLAHHYLIRHVQFMSVCQFPDPFISCFFSGYESLQIFGGLCVAASSAVPFVSHSG